MSAHIATRAFHVGAMGLAASVLIGCEFRPQVMSADARRVGDTELVKVDIRAQDAAEIKRRQFYFYLVVVNCEGEEAPFAMDPYIAGQRAAEFQFPVTGESTEVTGSMPVQIFEKYALPCVRFEGGGYLTGTLRSDPVPIKGGLDASQ